LARLFAVATQPTHRALDDARATVDVLHALIERVGNQGVHTYADLRSYLPDVTPAQRRKRVLADGLPHRPGVYLFRGPAGEVLYVGTAVDLRRRVGQYFTGADPRGRMKEMVTLTSAVDHVECAHSLEAGVRELRMLAAHAPPYNRRSRFPQRWWWLTLTDEPFPRLSAVRAPRHERAVGPFRSRSDAADTATLLARFTGLRTCTARLGRSALHGPGCPEVVVSPCPADRDVTATQYAAAVARVAALIDGLDNGALAAAVDQVTLLAERRHFESAARLRDRISALSAIQGDQSVNPRSIAEADVFAITDEAGQFCVEVFFFRTYQNWGNRAYFPRADRALSREEVLDAFLAQFYLDRPAPRLVLLSHEVQSAATLSEVLSARVGRRVAIGAPKRGEKKDLVDAALRNAREALSRKLAETATQEKLIAALSEAFGVDHPIRRVEIYDNSHIMGTNAIGAMVVAGPEGFIKNQYRTFNIKSLDLTPGDDYAMMREVLTRRFARLKRQGETAEPGAFPDTPDLVIIDGGRGQFEAARGVIGALDVEGIRLVAIAKGPDRNAGRETFFMEGRDPFRLTPRDPALFFIQRLRDEAHRFAVGTHRARRKKEFVKSPLDEIPGIGPARKRALLFAFGSAKDVAKAGLSDLEKTPGLNAATAKLVYDFFHENRAR
jgi:excinuclease ABC subunit C